MKKTVALLLVAYILIISLAGCAAPAQQSPSPAPEAPAQQPAEQPTENVDPSTVKYKIGFSANTPSEDANQMTHYEEMERYGKELGHEMIMLDPNGDPVTQQSQIENLIEMGVDAIILRATNATSLIPAIKKAYEAGIPVVVNANGIDESGFEYMAAYVGMNEVAMAEASAQMIMDKFKDSDKEEIRIAELAHIPGTTLFQQRSEAFRSVLEGTKFKIVESQTAEGKREKGQQITENWLLKYGPGELDAIYVQGTGMGFGVLDAIREAKRTGEIVVTFIATRGESWDMIKAGELYGSVDQNALTEARLGLETAIKAIEGQPVEKLTYLPVTITTQENIDQTTRPVW